ncbi:MarR family winged helix-turn-helix transcriptional regulator [Jatrophihabitans sp. YIM 134969]
MDDSDIATSLAGFSTWWRRVADRGGFSTTALSTLDTLDRLGPQRISDLASRERITQPGMTGLVTRLADEGMVERVQDAADGRVTRASITAAGRARLAALREERREQLAHLVAQLGTADQRALAAAAPALERLAAVALQGVAA